MWYASQVDVNGKDTWQGICWPGGSEYAYLKKPLPEKIVLGSVFPNCKVGWHDGWQNLFKDCDCVFQWIAFVAWTHRPQYTYRQFGLLKKIVLRRSIHSHSRDPHRIGIGLYENKNHIAWHLYCTDSISMLLRLHMGIVCWKCDLNCLGLPFIIFLVWEIGYTWAAEILGFGASHNGERVQFNCFLACFKLFCRFTIYMKWISITQSKTWLRFNNLLSVLLLRAQWLVTATKFSATSTKKSFSDQNCKFSVSGTILWTSFQSQFYHTLAVFT